ncbi:TetR/AcrR family transcriptional regulator [Rhodococcus sp. HNM0569]|nr:TetR/AcrR family transcriptional regulator [Rhodococcus sp. HNM0569]
METRAEIIRSAAAVFEQTGYDGASLGEIVTRAGITKGALYFHFRSKDELAQVVVAEQHAISIASVDAIAATDSSALEQIVMLCHEMGRQMVEDAIVRAGIRLTLELSATVGPAEPYLDWISSCEILTLRAIDEGDLLPTVSPPMLGRFVIGAYTGVQLVSNVLTQRTDLEQRLDEMWQIVLPGLMPPARRHKLPAIRAARWRPVER